MLVLLRVLLSGRSARQVEQFCPRFRRVSTPENRIRAFFHKVERVAQTATAIDVKLGPGHVETDFKTTRRTTI
jgi:hypothetical protein